MKSKELKEVGYLYVIQIVNFVLPIALMAYLSKILGLDGYGKLSFYQISSFLMIFFVDFGFNQSAAQRFIGKLQEEKDKIFNNTQVVKFLFSVMIIILMIIFYQFNTIKLDNFDRNILIISSVSTIATVFSSAWLYQAISKNSIFALINVAFRVISFLVIIAMVKEKNDLMDCILIQFFSSILIGLCSLFYLLYFKVVSINLKLIDKSFALDLIKDSYHIFLASFITLGFTYLNPLFVKFFFGDSLLGLYSIADKIASTLKMVFTPFSQAFYSKFCLYANEKKYMEIRKLSKKIILFFIVVSVIGLILNNIIGDYVYNYVLGFSTDLVKLLNIMIVSQMIVGTAIVLVNLNLIPLKLIAILKKIYLFGLLLHFSYLYFFVLNYGVFGIAFSVLLTELALVVMFYIYLYRFYIKQRLSELI